MHNFVYLAQWRSQEFSCEPNFGGGGCSPLGCTSGSPLCNGTMSVCLSRRSTAAAAGLLQIGRQISRDSCRWRVLAIGRYLSPARSWQRHVESRGTRLSTVLFRIGGFIGNESAPIQLAQYRFPGLAISNEKKY